MNMIKVNFIPQEARKDRGNIWQDGFGPLPREEIIGIIVAAAGVLVAIHVVLAGQALVKAAQHTMLQVHWNSMGAQKKVLDDVTKETKSLQTRMNALRPVTSGQGVLWARVLNEISDSVPRGLWVREVRFEKGMLVISGSAISKVRNEIIIVNNFVSALKDRAELKKDFTGIDVDSIQSRDDTTLSIADFSLKAKRRGL